MREAGDTAPVDVETVQKILSERDDARAARDWNRADALRDTLADAHGAWIRAGARVPCSPMWPTAATLCLQTATLCDPGVTVQDNEQKWYVGGRAGGGGPAGGGRERGAESGRRNRESRYDRGGYEQGRYDGGGGRDEGRYADEGCYADDGGNSGTTGYERGGREQGGPGGGNTGYEAGGRGQGRYGRSDDRPAITADGIAPRYTAPRSNGGDPAF